LLVVELTTLPIFSQAFTINKFTLNCLSIRCNYYQLTG